jgi:hypothetical protein
MTSAYFFDGRIKSSKAGLTNFEYCRDHETIGNYTHKPKIKRKKPTLVCQCVLWGVFCLGLKKYYDVT